MDLIVGGTGALGSALTRRLLAAGRSVRVMTRTPEKATDLAAEGAEIVHGDLLDPASLERACSGAEVVVAAAHSLFGRGRNASAHVDGRGHRDLVAAARSAGVRHFVYTSVYDFGAVYQAVPLFRIKYEMEEHLKVSGLSYTILRPTLFMESHAHALIGEPIIQKGKVALFGRGEQLRNFVAADDVARIAVLAITDSSLAGQTLDIGGPENMTNMDVVKLYEELSGREAKVSHVPLGLIKLMSRVLRPLHPGLSQVLQVGVLADTTDQSFDARSLQARSPIELTRLEDWARERMARSERLAA